MSNFVDFSSWPREQEQSFVVFEQRAQESQTKAWMISGITAGIVFIMLVGIYLGVTPEMKDMTKDMNMSNLSSKKKKAEAPAPTPAPAAAPAAPAEAEKK